MMVSRAPRPAFLTAKSILPLCWVAVGLLLGPLSGADAHAQTIRVELLTPDITPEKLPLQPGDELKVRARVYMPTNTTFGNFGYTGSNASFIKAELRMTARSDGGTARITDANTQLSMQKDSLTELTYSKSTSGPTKAVFDGDKTSHSLYGWKNSAAAGGEGYFEHEYRLRVTAVDATKPDAKICPEFSLVYTGTTTPSLNTATACIPVRMPKLEHTCVSTQALDSDRVRVDCTVKGIGDDNTRSSLIKTKVVLPSTLDLDHEAIDGGDYSPAVIKPENSTLSGVTSKGFTLDYSPSLKKGEQFVYAFKARPSAITAYESTQLFGVTHSYTTHATDPNKLLVNDRAPDVGMRVPKLRTEILVPNDTDPNRVYQVGDEYEAKIRVHTSPYLTYGNFGYTGTQSSKEFLQFRVEALRKSASARIDNPQSQMELRLHPQTSLTYSRYSPDVKSPDLVGDAVFHRIYGMKQSDGQGGYVEHIYKMRVDSADELAMIQKEVCARFELSFPNSVNPPVRVEGPCAKVGIPKVTHECASTQAEESDRMDVECVLRGHGDEGTSAHNLRAEVALSADLELEDDGTNDFGRSIDTLGNQANLTSLNRRGFVIEYANSLMKNAEYRYKFTVRLTEQAVFGSEIEVRPAHVFETHRTDLRKLTYRELAATGPKIKVGSPKLRAEVPVQDSIYGTPFVARVKLEVPTGRAPIDRDFYLAASPELGGLESPLAGYKAVGAEQVLQSDDRIFFRRKLTSNDFLVCNPGQSDCRPDPGPDGVIELRKSNTYPNSLFRRPHERRLVEAKTIFEWDQKLCVVPASPGRGKGGGSTKLRMKEPRLTVAPKSLGKIVAPSFDGLSDPSAFDPNAELEGGDLFAFQIDITNGGDAHAYQNLIDAVPANLPITVVDVVPPPEGGCGTRPATLDGTTSGGSAVVNTVQRDGRNCPLLVIARVNSDVEHDATFDRGSLTVTPTYYSSPEQDPNCPPQQYGGTGEVQVLNVPTVKVKKSKVTNVRVVGVEGVPGEVGADGVIPASLEAYRCSQQASNAAASDYNLLCPPLGSVARFQIDVDVPVGQTRTLAPSLSLEATNSGMPLKFRSLSLSQSAQLPEIQILDGGLALMAGQTTQYSDSQNRATVAITGGQGIVATNTGETNRLKIPLYVANRSTATQKVKLYATANVTPDLASTVYRPQNQGQASIQVEATVDNTSVAKRDIPIAAPKPLFFGYTTPAFLTENSNGRVIAGFKHGPRARGLICQNEPLRVELKSVDATVANTATDGIDNDFDGATDAADPDEAALRVSDKRVLAPLRSNNPALAGLPCVAPGEEFKVEFRVDTARSTGATGVTEVGFATYRSGPKVLGQDIGRVVSVVADGFDNDGNARIDGSDSANGDIRRFMISVTLPCGNGQRDPGEECDPNEVAYKGTQNCSSACKLVGGFTETSVQSDLFYVGPQTSSVLGFERTSTNFGTKPGVGYATGSSGFTAAFFEPDSGFIIGLNDAGQFIRVADASSGTIQDLPKNLGCARDGISGQRCFSASTTGAPVGFAAVSASEIYLVTAALAPAGPRVWELDLTSGVPTLVGSPVDITPADAVVTAVALRPETDEVVVYVSNSVTSVTDDSESAQKEGELPAVRLNSGFHRLVLERNEAGAPQYSLKHKTTAVTLEMAYVKSFFFDDDRDQIVAYGGPSATNLHDFVGVNWSEMKVVKLSPGPALGPVHFLKFRRRHALTTPAIPTVECQPGDTKSVTVKSRISNRTVAPATLTYRLPLFPGFSLPEGGQVDVQGTLVTPTIESGTLSVGNIVVQQNTSKLVTVALSYECDAVDLPVTLQLQPVTQNTGANGAVVEVKSDFPDTATRGDPTPVKIIDSNFIAVDDELLALSDFHVTRTGNFNRSALYGNDGSGFDPTTLRLFPDAASIGEECIPPDDAVCINQAPQSPLVACGTECFVAENWGTRRTAGGALVQLVNTPLGQPIWLQYSAPAALTGVDRFFYRMNGTSGDIRGTAAVEVFVNQIPEAYSETGTSGITEVMLGNTTSTSFSLTSLFTDAEAQPGDPTGGIDPQSVSGASTMTPPGCAQITAGLTSVTLTPVLSNMDLEGALGTCEVELRGCDRGDVFNLRSWDRVNNALQPYDQTAGPILPARGPVGCALEPKVVTLVKDQCRRRKVDIYDNDCDGAVVSETCGQLIGCAVCTICGSSAECDPAEPGSQTAMVYPLGSTQCTDTQ
jgi:hypothetical protein